MQHLATLFIPFLLFCTSHMVQAKTGLPYLEHTISRLSIGTNLNAVAFGNNVYVATGSDDNISGNGNILISDDAKNWKTSKSEYYTSFNGVKYLNGQFYAFGNWRALDEEYKPYYSRIWSSSNGSDWTVVYSEIKEGNPQLGVTDIAYGDGFFVFSINNRMFVSTNNFGSASQTTAINGTGLADHFGLSKVCYGNNMFVALNTVSRSWAVNMAYSHDGLTWKSIANEPVAENIAFVNNHFVTLSGGYMRVSENGTDWQNIPQGKGSSIAYANGTYMIPNAIVGHPQTDLRYSTNLQTNISKIFRRNLGFDEWSDLRDVVAGKDGFVIVGGAGVFVAPYNKMGDYPQIMVTDTIDMALGQNFVYCLSAKAFSPNMIRINLEPNQVLPSGIIFNHTTSGKGINEQCPHFTGIPSQIGNWPMWLYVYETGFGDQELYVKQRVVFRVLDKTNSPKALFNHVYVYPTITKKNFYINNPKNIETITLYDAQGNKLLAYDIENGTGYCLNGLHGGTYFVRIKLKSGEFQVSRILKM